jgi:hypothetical protein
MGKKKQKNGKRALSPDGSESSNKKEVTSNALAVRVATATTPSKIENLLLDQQSRFMEQKGLTDTERHEFFSPSIASDRRAELWMAQADLGEELVNRYAWATPNSVAIRILKEFSPLVEIGCGSNAYWCQILRKSGVDILGYDVNISSGGLIEGSSKKKKKKNKEAASNPSYLKQGGPDILSSKELQKSGRTLFLCYPDDDEDEGTTPPIDSDEDEDEESPSLPTSMGWQSLHHYSGEYVIHVGETFLDANFSMEQAPWGRSSAPEFQQRLASEYHCLLKVELPNWFHTRDSISVWKRSTNSTIVFAADEDEDETGQEDEEVEYRHIPRNERLPMNIAAPCLAHLLPGSKGGPNSQKSPRPSKPQPTKEKPAVSSSQKRSQSMRETDVDTPVREKTGNPEASRSRKKKKKEQS